MNLDAIFKAYDIRGRIDNGELDPEVAQRIGAAFAVFAQSDRVAVGRDIRTSSAELAAAFIAGVVSQGVDVDDIGTVATDMSYYYAGAAGVAAAMVTASHLPLNWNGMKLTLSGARPVSGDSGLEEIKALTVDAPEPASTTGRVRERNILHAYVEHLFSIVDEAAFRPMRVAVDGGNGMAGVVLPSVFDRLPVDVTGLYLEPDGTFPNHPADPTRPENLADLEAVMADGGYDLGVAFDADADRAIFLDDQGNTVSGSTTTAIIADWYLGRHPGATVVYNLICSRAVPETIRAAGGNPVRTRVGHSFIKAVMLETDAVFGGEHSAHFYFRDNYRADSGTLAMLVLMQLLGAESRSLSELRRDYEPYSQSGEINFEVQDQHAVSQAVEGAFDGMVDHTDGLTMEWDDRWFNLRPSNTEPLLRLNVEAPDFTAVEGLVDQVAAVIGSVGGVRV